MSADFQQVVTAYTDGSCTNGRGGWAAIMVFGDGTERELRGFDPQTTANRMELRAVIGVLEALPRPTHVLVATDSELTMLCGRGEWKRRSNTDLWARFDEAADLHRMEWEKVEAHTGHHYNERADDLAREASGKRRAAA